QRVQALEKDLACGTLPEQVFAQTLLRPFRCARICSQDRLVEECDYSEIRFLNILSGIALARCGRCYLAQCLFHSSPEVLRILHLLAPALHAYGRGQDSLVKQRKAL